MDHLVRNTPQAPPIGGEGIAVIINHFRSWTRDDEIPHLLVMAFLMDAFFNIVEDDLTVRDTALVKDNLERCPFKVSII
jgi:hypothetical protein